MVSPASLLSKNLGAVTTRGARFPGPAHPAGPRSHRPSTNASSVQPSIFKIKRPKVLICAMQQASERMHRLQDTQSPAAVAQAVRRPGQAEDESAGQSKCCRVGIREAVTAVGAQNTDDPGTAFCSTQKGCKSGS